jgi:hypothetical protein
MTEYWGSDFACDQPFIPQGNLMDKAQGTSFKVWGAPYPVMRWRRLSQAIFF